MKTETIRPGLCGSTPWRALVVPAATVIAATALGTTAQSAPRQAPVTGNVVFQMMDHEDFGKNERCRHDNPVVNNLGRAPGRFWYFGKCGGEVRAEIHYQLSRNNDGSIELRDGEVKLFEGDSADTNDPGGGFPFALSPIKIPQGQTRTMQFHVDNVLEDEPDDKADITLTLTNNR
ncbi:hypothetical protein [Streptomyces sp. NPDC001530]|uniref:hypothetical protein n=1 Tax=Streptomyces sp. NPDC001530 TaxID=3364582 RepID=UPI0036B32688